jgi:hypothetical protein
MPLKFANSASLSYLWDLIDSDDSEPLDNIINQAVEESEPEQVLPIQIDEPKELKSNDSDSNFLSIFDSPEEKESSITDTLYNITSVVGDDFITTTNDIYFGKTILRSITWLAVQISWKDTGQSRHLANYAEEWLLTPLSEAIAWNTVNRFLSREAVGFTMDIVKLKNISPVRKTSELDVDLETKFTQLAKVTNWVQPAWITYDFHQLSIILALQTFDFRCAKAFPFLFKHEGGCGGKPPWMSPATNYNYIARYRNGKATDALLGIMRETILINERKMDPRESIYVRLGRLIQCDPRRWNTLVNHIDDFHSAEELNRFLEKELIIPEIPHKEIHPRDLTIGPFISKLRKLGLIMTDRDILVYQEEQLRLDMFFQQMEIGQVIESKRKFKHFTFEYLKTFEKFLSKEDRNYLSNEQGYLALITLFDKYHRYHDELKDNYTTFIYDYCVNIYDSKIVKDMLGNFSNRMLLTRFMNKSRNQIRDPFQVREPEIYLEAVDFINRRLYSEIITWEIPIGIGTDDARIIHELMQYSIDHGTHRVAIIIATYDKALIRSCTAHFSHLPWVFLQLEPEEVFKIFYYWHMPSEYQIKNPFTGVMSPLPKYFIESVKRKAFFIRESDIKIYLLYDHPNVERSLAKYLTKNRVLYQNIINPIKIKTCIDSKKEGHSILLTNLERLRQQTAMAQVPVVNQTSRKDPLKYSLRQRP